MTTVQTALLRSVEILKEHAIPYAITGSFSAAHHGYVRATEDVDIQVAPSDRHQLETLDPLPPDITRIDPETWILPGDIHVELHPVQDDLDAYAMENRTQGTLANHTLWFVPLEALLVLKIREATRHGHGHKHYADIQHLLARNHDTIDPTKLETLLALDPTWQETWNEHIERV